MRGFCAQFNVCFGLAGPTIIDVQILPYEPALLVSFIAARVSAFAENGTAIQELEVVSSCKEDFIPQCVPLFIII